MRKQTKLVAVLSAAALLAIGASMTSFAAKGWVEENGSWYYYNTDDDYATNDWKKSGNNWFWLGDDGAMMTSALIEDGDNKYYVNASGAMVTNSWVAVEPGDDSYEDDAPDHYWYYFGANGKAYKQTGTKLSIKTINGKKYGFDQDGKMVYGFVTEEGVKNTDSDPFVDAMYYFGTSDDGAMHTGWLQYNDGSDASSSITGKEYSDQDVMWFYFKPSNGKKADDQDKGKIKEENINGRKYGFDENGVMVYEWQYKTAASTSSASDVDDYKYFSSEEDGHLQKKTWLYAVPSEELSLQGEEDTDDYDNDQQRWFYAESNGETVKAQIKKINGKKYLFDNIGRMKSGLQWVSGLSGKNIKIDTKDDIKDTGDQIKAYNDASYPYLMYFSADEEKDGAMKTGKNVKIELDDDTYTFAFKSNGAAYDYTKDGLVDKKIYKNGILIKAGTDDRYTTFPVSGDALNLQDGAVVGNVKYVVGTSGTVVNKGRYVKDGDDNYWAVTKKDGDVIWVDGSEDYASQKASCYAKDQKPIERYNSDGSEVIGYKCE